MDEKKQTRTVLRTITYSICALILIVSFMSIYFVNRIGISLGERPQFYLVFSAIFSLGMLLWMASFDLKNSRTFYVSGARMGKGAFGWSTYMYIIRFLGLLLMIMAVVALAR